MAGDKSAGKHRKAKAAAVHAERRAKVMTYILAGATVRDIAAELGVSPATVIADKKAALKELNEQERQTATEYRALEDARLNEMFFAVWPDAQAGDIDSIGLVMRIHERKGKLWGYDAAQKLEVTGAGGKAIKTENANTNIELKPEDLEGLSAAELAQRYFGR